jgi:hypothetical protein
VYDPRLEIAASRPGGVGFHLQVPPGVTVLRASDSFQAVERSRSGRVIGEIEVAVFYPSLIMDRDGVLWEAARGLARAALTPPRRGYAHDPFEMVLSGGPAWRADVVLERDPQGVPPLCYHSALALGHPDLRRGAALLVVLRSAAERWPAGFAMVDSLGFLGRASSALPAPRATLPLAV